MNPIIIAAIVMAIAGVGGMLFLHRWSAFNARAATTAQVDLHSTRARLSVAQVEARATSELATQMAHEARALENIVKAKDAEIARLAKAQPHYGRDPKTGRFVKQSLNTLAASAAAARAGRTPSWSD